MLYNALQKAKKVEDKKVAINIQVPSNLKSEFDKLCKDESVSMTALICALMEDAIEEHGKSSLYKNDTMELIEKLDKESEKFDEYAKCSNDNASPDDVGLEGHDWNYYLDIQRTKVNAIKTELENRGRRAI